MNRKPFVPILFAVLLAAIALGGCAKKNGGPSVAGKDVPRMAKNEIPRGESHLALDTSLPISQQYLFFYSDSIVSTIAPLFNPSPSNGCAFVQICAGPPGTFTLQSVKSVFSSAYSSGQVRLMYATAPVSGSGGVPYDTSWQIAVNTPTPFPASFRDVLVAQYQTAPGAAWTPFDRVTVTDTAYNPEPNQSQSWITTPGQYYINYLTNDNATAAATFTISVP